jgi:hypothetical protein
MSNLLLLLFKGLQHSGNPCVTLVVTLLFALLSYNCAPPDPGPWVCEVELTSVGPHELVLFYRADEGQGFDASRSVGATKVDRSTPGLYQLVLPDTVALVDLRLDLGSDSTLKLVEIQRIALRNENGVIEISAEEIPRFFSLNTFAPFGTEPGSILLNPQEDRFDPFLRAKPILKHRLKMTKKGIWH